MSEGLACETNSDSRFEAIQAHEILQGGGVTTIGAMSRAATGVKMQSNGQGTFWGLVNSQAVCWGTIFSTTGDQGAWLSLCACGQGSRAKIRHGEAVMPIF